MAFNLFGPKPAAPEPSQQGVDRRRAIAEALMRVQMPQGQQAGRFYVAPSPWAQLAGGIANVAGQWQMGKADAEQKAVDSSMAQRMAEALLKQGASPQDVELFKQQPIEQQRQVLGQMVATKLAPKSPQNLERQDTGTEILLTNPATGQVVQRFPKGATPDARLSNETTRRGQDISATTATRGQDLTASTTRRGQDISAQTTQRGQDISAQTAAANRATTERGQDITARTAAATQSNKPLTEYQSKAVGQLSRMQGAEKTLGELQSKGFSPSYIDSGLAKVGNFAERPESQQYKQAAGEFIAGILRLDSGAAVPEVEFDRYFKVYFPQPGDSEQVVAQKAEARERAMEGLRSGIGQAGSLVPRRDPSGVDPTAQLASVNGAPELPRIEAPQAAVQFLQANPSPENRAQFKEKFGYLPPGM